MGLQEEIEAIQPGELTDEFEAWSELDVEEQKRLIDRQHLREKYPGLIELVDRILEEYNILARDTAHRPLSAFVITLVRYAETPKIEEMSVSDSQEVRVPFRQIVEQRLLSEAPDLYEKWQLKLDDPMMQTSLWAMLEAREARSAAKNS